MAGLKDGMGGGTGLSGVEEEMSADMLFTSGNKVLFRDAGLYINSGADGKLTISADGTGTDDITLAGAVTVSGDMDINAALDIDATTTSTTAVIDVANAGTGKGLRLDLNNVADP